MKFLCVSCDQPMKLTSADHPAGAGSISAVFACPSCDQQIAMLTNPAETQMVQSLGVKIGPGEQEEAASSCPFSGMLADMESRAQGADEVTWTAAALSRLKNIPEFVRPMAKQGVESWAKSNGHSVVDETVMEEARGSFGM